MSGEVFDHRSISAEEYRVMIAKAIERRELEAAVQFLTVMATVHPREAVDVYDDIQAALRIRKALAPP